MFIAYEVSLELARELRPIVPAIKKHSRDLGDQLERAATSVMLNLGEGRRRRGGDQRRFFDFAHGSASEVKTALDLIGEVRAAKLELLDDRTQRADEVEGIRVRDEHGIFSWLVTTPDLRPPERRPRRGPAGEAGRRPERPCAHDQ